jgi:23S rRNA (pseudouridine1915-N3)-methyltransferase
MKVVILCVGKTDVPYIETGLAMYSQRLTHYVSLEWSVIPEQKAWKKLNPDARKKAEGTAILSRILPGDLCILLDEKGKMYTSEEFAARLEKAMLAGTRRLVLVIGGAFGFSDEVYQAVPERLSLSKMTFSHQMVRLFLVEQVYRGFTILRNEPYHNS